MSWRLAQSLEKLREQVNERWPNRSKDSDGSIGDASHSSRSSDHNPDDHGVVHAIDITHDPRGGFDSYAFADLILKKQDPRLRYVISNKRIGSGPAGPAAGSWRPYRVPPNKNPHDHHCHISVIYDHRADNASAWDISGDLFVKPEVVAAHQPLMATLRKGDHGPNVQTMQGRLNAHGANLKVDGDFGVTTEGTVKRFQTGQHLVADGICGPQTWKALT